MKETYSLTIVPDKEGEEEFTKSNCNCASCIAMHLANLEWDTFTTKTSLQRNMKNVVKKIEGEIKLRRSSRISNM